MNSLNMSWAREARALAGISVAVAVTLFAQLAISAVETVIVARLGIEALAGVTLALGLFLLFFLFSLGVVSAVTPIVASAYGRGDMEGLRRSGQQGLWVGLTFSVPSMLILLAARYGLTLVFGHSPEIESASLYLAGAAWGLPAWVSYVWVRCLAVATGRVRVTSVVMLAAVPVHAAVTWLLVFGGLGLPPLGVFGAGLAYTLTAFSALGMVAAILRAAPQGAFGTVFHRPFTIDPKRYLEIVRLGIPFAIRIVLREGVLPAASFVIAPFGASAIAAHAVATRIVGLTGVLSFGLSNAANMRVSYALGAASPHQAKRAGWIAIQLATFIGALVAALLIAEKLTLARWILGDDDAVGVASAAALLPVAACLQCLEAVQAPTGGALNALRDAKGPLVITIIGSWVVGMPIGIVLARSTATPVIGLWLGLVAGGSLTTALYLLRFRRKMAERVARTSP